VHDGREHPVAYVSRALGVSEQNYSVIEKELLAMIFALKKFRTYVYGTQIIMYTDHNPLQYISTIKDPSRRMPDGS